MKSAAYGVKKNSLSNAQAKANAIGDRPRQDDLNICSDSTFF